MQHTGQGLEASNPVGHSRGERARFFGCSELLQRSFSFAAKQGRAWWGDSFAGCGWATAARRRDVGVDRTGPRGGGVDRTALAASRLRSGGQAPLRRRAVRLGGGRVGAGRMPDAGGE